MAKRVSLKDFGIHLEGIPGELKTAVVRGLRTPGAKAAAVIGSAGFFRVNSLHHQGLNEAQRSPRLMTTAYSVEDGLVEALESPEHSWVIGFQCHPERQDEVPRSFANLFAAFLDRAEMHQQKAEAATP